MLRDVQERLTFLVLSTFACSGGMNRNLMHVHYLIIPALKAKFYTVSRDL